MRGTIGTLATRVHFLLVALIGLTGIGVLLMLASVMLLETDQYSRDMGLLGAIITAPIWIVGVLAAIDAAFVVRGRRVSRRRALGWALAAVVAGAFLANAGGHFAILGAIVTDPHRVALGWPAILLVTTDGMGANNYYVNQPTFWAPIVALPLGIASLVAVALDANRKPRTDLPHRRPR